MLSNADLAELIESTRDRVSHMGGGTPTAVGIVQLLNGAITMLRQEVPEDAQPSEPPSEPDEQEVPAATEGAPQTTDSEQPDQEPVPGYLQHMRATRRERRRPVREALEPKSQKPSNPLLNPQYADFFNSLIAQQKAPASPREPSEGAAAQEEVTSPPHVEPAPQEPPVPEESTSAPVATFRDETATG